MKKERDPNKKWFVPLFRGEEPRTAYDSDEEHLDIDRGMLYEAIIALSEDDDGSFTAPEIVRIIGFTRKKDSTNPRITLSGGTQYGLHRAGKDLRILASEGIIEAASWEQTGDPRIGKTTLSYRIVPGVFERAVDRVAVDSEIDDRIRYGQVA